MSKERTSVYVESQIDHKRFQRTPIRSFHKYIRQYADPQTYATPPNPIQAEVAIVGRFRLGNIANIDQVPLEFEFLSGCTYDTSGTKIVWWRSHGSCLDNDKQQYSLQYMQRGFLDLSLYFRGYRKKSMGQTSLCSIPSKFLD